MRARRPGETLRTSLRPLSRTRCSGRGEVDAVRRADEGGEAVVVVGAGTDGGVEVEVEVAEAGDATSAGERAGALEGVGVFNDGVARGLLIGSFRELLDASATLGTFWPGDMQRVGGECRDGLQGVPAVCRCVGA
jgi:hypothetical protein